MCTAHLRSLHGTGFSVPQTSQKSAKGRSLSAVPWLSQHMRMALTEEVTHLREWTWSRTCRSHPCWMSTEDPSQLGVFLGIALDLHEHPWNCQDTIFHRWLKMRRKKKKKRMERGRERGGGKGRGAGTEKGWRRRAGIKSALFTLNVGYKMKTKPAVTKALPALPSAACS